MIFKPNGRPLREHSWIQKRFEGDDNAEIQVWSEARWTWETRPLRDVRIDTDHHHEAMCVRTLPPHHCSGLGRELDRVQTDITKGKMGEIPMKDLRAIPDSKYTPLRVAVWGQVSNHLNDACLKLNARRARRAWSCLCSTIRTTTCCCGWNKPRSRTPSSTAPHATASSGGMHGSPCGDGTPRIMTPSAFPTVSISCSSVTNLTRAARTLDGWCRRRRRWFVRVRQSAR